MKRIAMRFVGWVGGGLGSADPVGLIKLRPKLSSALGMTPIASWQVQGPTIKRVCLKWFTEVGLVPESECIAQESLRIL